MEIFLIKYIVNAYKNTLKLFGRVVEIYKTNDRYGRYSVCMTFVVFDVLFILLNIVLKFLVRGSSFFTGCILVGAVVLTALILDLRNLKKYKEKVRMNARDEAFLKAIAQEKGVNPITMKKYGNEENKTDLPAQPAAAPAVLPKPEVKPEPKKKETLSDLPSAEEMAEMERK